MIRILVCVNWWYERGWIAWCIQYLLSKSNENNWIASLLSTPSSHPFLTAKLERQNVIHVFHLLQCYILSLSISLQDHSIRLFIYIEWKKISFAGLLMNPFRFVCYQLYRQGTVALFVTCILYSMHWRKQRRPLKKNSLKSWSIKYLRFYLERELTTLIYLSKKIDAPVVVWPSAFSFPLHLKTEWDEQLAAVPSFDVFIHWLIFSSFRFAWLNHLKIDRPNSASRLFICFFVSSQESEKRIQLPHRHVTATTLIIVAFCLNVSERAERFNRYILVIHALNSSLMVMIFFTCAPEKIIWSDNYVSLGGSFFFVCNVETIIMRVLNDATPPPPPNLQFYWHIFHVIGSTSLYLLV